jgi:hypothetical protein
MIVQYVDKMHEMQSIIILIYCLCLMNQSIQNYLGFICHELQIKVYFGIIKFENMFFLFFTIFDIILLYFIDIKTQYCSSEI